MSACEQLSANAAAGVAPALRAVDCLASETTAAAFENIQASPGSESSPASDTAAQPACASRKAALRCASPGAPVRQT